MFDVALTELMAIRPFSLSPVFLVSMRTFRPAITQIAF